MEDNWFTGFCRVLSDLNKNQPQAHPRPLPPGPPPVSSTPACSLSSPSRTARSHSICFTHGPVRFHVTLSLLPRPQVCSLCLFLPCCPEAHRPFLKILVLKEQQAPSHRWSPHVQGVRVVKSQSLCFPNSSWSLTQHKTCRHLKENKYLESFGKHFLTI